MIVPGIFVTMVEMNNIKSKQKSTFNEINNLSLNTSNNTQLNPVYSTTTSSRMENPFERLAADMTEIKTLLYLLLEEKKVPVQQSDLIDLDEASDLLKISKSTIYKMTASNRIPFIKRDGSSKLIFSRAHLNNWVTESNVSKVNLVEEHLHKNLRVRKVQFN